jgi:hypothetical protein
MDNHGSDVGRAWSGFGRAGALALAFVALGACAAGSDDVVPADARDGTDDADVPPDVPDGETAGPAPTLITVSPPSGPIDGGSLVTLTGENFATGATAAFGGTACTEPFVHTPRRMACRTPAHAEGAVDVTVNNLDGQSATLTGAFTYNTTAPQVNWCALHYPAEISVAPDSPAGPISGRVFVQDVTPGDGQGPGVRGQIGVGALGSDPATWIWVDATYNISVDAIVPGDLANDEYAATILGPSVGEYSYAFRFSVDDGTTWLLCDRTGSDDGFSVAVAGTMHVVPAPPPSVGWCRLDRPVTTSVELEGLTEPIYGRVFVDGVTEGDGEGAGVRGAIGVGRAGTEPTPASWSWWAMPYTASVDGVTSGDLANDEYGTALPAPVEVGEWLYAVRFSVDGGTTWTTCDTVGAGYTEINAGRLTVTDPAVGPLVGWCNLQWPSALRTTVGVATEFIYGRVYAAGITEGAGQGAGVHGQVGYGASAAAPATWTWVDASYNISVDGLISGGLANDEYWQSLTVSAAGTYAYAYRFSLDGTSWRYCDLDGTAVGEFTVDQAGTLVVE